MLSGMQLTPLVSIDRIAPDGAGETMYEGRPLRVFGMLPGERGVVEIKKRKGIFVGTLKELRDASPDRVLPIDSHYLSSAPWQCMTYPLQATLKAELLARTYAYYPNAPKPEFISASAIAGYRTKVEFSVIEEDGGLILAFHERGRWNKLLPAPSGTILASPAMNNAAKDVLSRLHDAGLRARDIKAIVIRESKLTGALLGIVYLRQDRSDVFASTFRGTLSGLILVYSDSRSPASVTTRVLDSIGETSLLERVADVDFEYPWDAFFQNNVPMFERALSDIRGAILPNMPILDLYAGVGTIGISLADDGRAAHCVEVSRSAIASAKVNAHRAGRMTVTVESLPAENCLEEVIARYPCVVVDPPRAGLHPKLISMFLRNPPARLIYLSCNPQTQARDFSVLAQRFQIDRIVGYDFYPQTPHFESLLVLSRIDRT